MINESSESGELITITVSDDTYINPADAAHWTVNNLPTGVTKGAVTYVNATEITLALSGNSTIDYDVDITDVSISCTAAALTTNAVTGASASTGVTLIADNDAENIAISWHSTPGTSGVEATMDAEVVQITLTNGTFISGQVNTTNITASGTATTLSGVSIESVSYVDATTVDVALAWNSTDYDLDKTLTLTVVTAAYNDSYAGSSLSNDITLTATDEGIESISVAWHATPGTNGTESTMDAEVVQVTLTNAQFISGNVNTTNITATGTATSAAGVSIETVSYVDATTVDVALAWDQTDYDTDKTLTLNVAAATYYDGSVLLTNDITLTATGEGQETVALSWHSTPGTSGVEATMDAEVVQITLSNGSFISAGVTTGNITASGTAISEAGVTIQTVTYVDATTVDVALAWDQTDYDSDKTLTIEVADGAYSDGIATISNNINLPNTDEGVEAVTLAWGTPPGTSGVEATMDSEVIQITLANGNIIRCFHRISQLCRCHPRKCISCMGCNRL